MPTRNLEDWFDSYVHYCHDSEPPTKFHEWCAVSVIAAALQRKCKLVWGSLIHYPNFYIALTAPPGEARKGTAMAFARTFLDNLNVPIAADATSPQALLQRMMESSDTLVGTEDNYIETHSSLTVFSREFTVFLGYANKEFMSYLCDFYDCIPRFDYRTISRGNEEIIGVWLNIFGATTPDLIQIAMPTEIVGSGLTSRIIFVYEPRIKQKVACPFFTLSPEGQELYKKLLEDIHQIKALQGNFKVSKNFISDWIEFYNTMPLQCPFDPQRFGHYWSRRPVHIIKLSMIFSASRSNEMVVRRQDLERAVRFITETEVKMPRAFAGVGKSKQAETVNRIMSWIAIRSSVRFSDLVTEFYRDAEKWELKNMVETLRSMNFISIIDIPGTDDFKINHIKPSETLISKNE